MVKMKALRSFGVSGANEGKVKRGREFSVASEPRAKDLENNGLAYRVDTKMEADAPLNKMEPPALNKTAIAGPLDSAGGVTGAENFARSSRPVLQQPMRSGRRHSRPSADEYES